MMDTSSFLTIELTCDEFACFWNHCRGWTLTWLITAGCDFICGCWALIELIHVYTSIYKIKSSKDEINITNVDNYGSNYILSFQSNHTMDIPCPQSSNSSKMQLFETRLSQKLFLLIRMVMCISVVFINMIIANPNGSAYSFIFIH